MFIETGVRKILPAPEERNPAVDLFIVKNSAPAGPLIPCPMVVYKHPAPPELRAWRDRPAVPVSSTS
jgi:hypothetical protein